MEMPAIVFSDKAAKPNIGGTINSKGIITMAPPTPRKPEMNPPAKLMQKNKNTTFDSLQDQSYLIICHQIF